MHFQTIRDATRTIDGVTDYVGTFDASVNADGTLDISVPIDTSTIDGSAWYTIDSSTSELNFWNYPEEISGIYSWINRYGNIQTLNTTLL